MDGTSALETWKAVPGFEGLYEASDQGQVRSLSRIVNNPRFGQTLRRGRMLKPIDRRGGYKLVKLSREGEITPMLVHHAVMLAFVGPRPAGWHTCHNNGDPADNRLANLRYDTPSANAFDSVLHGTCVQSRKTRCPNGHEYNDENTRLVATPSGSRVGRQCRACDKVRGQEKRARDREAYNAKARERRRMKKPQA